MEQPAAPSPVPVPDKKTANGAATGDAQGSSVGKTGHTPPYWGRHMRSISNVSYTSVQGSSRPQPIILEDNTEPEQQRSDAGKGLWARGVSIHDHVVVAGSAIGTGAYVVWVCKVDTLEGGSLEIRKRYSEFDRLRANLATTFPRSLSALPPLPPKSVVSRFRERFLEKRRQGLQYFLNCVILNPEFAGSPILKEFIFS